MLDKIRNMSDDEIIALLEETRSIHKALIKIGYNSYSKPAAKILLQKTKELNIVLFRVKSFTLQDLKNAVRFNYSYVDVLKDLKLVSSTANYRSVQETIKRHSIDVSHFDQMKSSGRKQIMSREDMFCIDSTTQRSRIRTAILRDNLIPYICQSCENTGTWKNSNLTLELDHINGNSRDHRLSNLRFLCPNCHSQTPTFRNGTSGRNRTDIVRQSSDHEV